MIVIHITECIGSHPSDPNTQTHQPHYREEGKIGVRDYFCRYYLNITQAGTHVKWNLALYRKEGDLFTFQKGIATLIGHYAEYILRGDRAVFLSDEPDTKLVVHWNIASGFHMDHIQEQLQLLRKKIDNHIIDYASEETSGEQTTPR